MKKIALFPGRFQPPHLGHILTIMRIYPIYDEIIVGISEYTYGGRKKRVLSTKKIMNILEKLFINLPKIKVIPMGRGVIERKSYDDLPPFDYIVTSNMEVIKVAEKAGYKTRFVPRSNDLHYLSGEQIRDTFFKKREVKK
jgi:nicotinamide-nucleotide adenylyltransferase